MVSTPHKIKKQVSCFRANVVGSALFFVSFIYLASCIGEIVQIQTKAGIAFFVQDVIEILLAGILGCVSILYCAFGYCSFQPFVHEKLRIGRRSCLHFIHIVFWMGFFSFLLSFTGFIHIGQSYDGSTIDAANILTGIGLSYGRIFTSLHSWLIIVFCILVYVFDFYRSSTFWYFIHKKEVRGVYEFIDEQRRLAPFLTFSVECYHYEQQRRTRTIHKTDKDGKSYTETETYYETVKVVTFKDSTYFVYSQFADTSGSFLLDGKHALKNFVRVKLDYEILFDSDESLRIYEAFGESFRNEHAWRDTHCDLTKNRTIPGFTKHAMASLKDKHPFWANFCFYFLFYLACCQMCYRYVFDQICGEQYFTLRKVVCAVGEIKRTRILDQNFDVDYVIVPGDDVGKSSKEIAVVDKNGNDVSSNQQGSMNPNFQPNEATGLLGDETGSGTQDFIQPQQFFEKGNNIMNGGGGDIPQPMMNYSNTNANAMQDEFPQPNMMKNNTMNSDVPQPMINQPMNNNNNNNVPMMMNENNTIENPQFINTGMNNTMNNNNLQSMMNNEAPNAPFQNQ